MQWSRCLLGAGACLHAAAQANAGNSGAGQNTAVDKLQRAVVSVLSQAATVERLCATGSDPVGGTPAELDAKIMREPDYSGSIIHAANTKVE